MKGIIAARRVFFRPNLSAAIPAANGPMAAPTGSREPIHVSWDVVSGVGRGLMSLLVSFSFGISGEVQPKAVPQTNAAILAEKKRKRCSIEKFHYKYE